MALADAKTTTTPYPHVFDDKDAMGNYENLRHIAPVVLEQIISLVLDLALQTVPRAVKILDAGAGTGRLSIPLAHEVIRRKQRAKIVAVDRSCRMLEALVQETRALRSFDAVQAVTADITKPLPKSCRGARVVVCMAVLHILADWRSALQHLVNSLAKDGYFIIVRELNQFMHETEGFSKSHELDTVDEELHAFMRHYHYLRASVGEPYEEREVQYSDLSRALSYLHDLGCSHIDADVDPKVLTWEKRHTYKDIMACFRQRQMTTWGSDLSEGARSKIASALEVWLDCHGIDREQEFTIPARLVPYLLRKK